MTRNSRRRGAFEPASTGTPSPGIPPELRRAINRVPQVLVPGEGQETTVSYQAGLALRLRLGIVRFSDDTPEIVAVRLLRDWEDEGPPRGTAVWDGRDDQGEFVTPGPYSLWLQATHRHDGTLTAAVGHVEVA